MTTVIVIVVLQLVLKMALYNYIRCNMRCDSK